MVKVVVICPKCGDSYIVDTRKPVSQNMRSVVDVIKSAKEGGGTEQ